MSRVKSLGIWKLLSPVGFWASNLGWRLSFGLIPSLRYLVGNYRSKKHVVVNNGLLIVHNNEFYVSFAERIRGFISEAQLSGFMAQMQERSDEKSFVMDIAPLLSKEAKFELIKFAIDEYNVASVSNYLKFFPVISSIKILLNIPKFSDKQGSQKWHRDGMVHKGMNIFTAITEINENRGMYSAIAFDAIPRRKVIRAAKSTGWNSDRVSEDEMLDYVDSDAVSNLKGEPGITALVDNGWIYHKGGYIKDGYRLMCEISYQSLGRPNHAVETPILKVLGMDLDEVRSEMTLSADQQYLLGKSGAQLSMSSIFHRLDRGFTSYKSKHS